MQPRKSPRRRGYDYSNPGYFGYVHLDGLIVMPTYIYGIIIICEGVCGEGVCGDAINCVPTVVVVGSSTIYKKKYLAIIRGIGQIRIWQRKKSPFVHS